MVTESFGYQCVELKGDGKLEVIHGVLSTVAANQCSQVYVMVEYFHNSKEATL